MGFTQIRSFIFAWARAVFELCNDIMVIKNMILLIRLLCQHCLYTHLIETWRRKIIWFRRKESIFKVPLVVVVLVLFYDITSDLYSVILPMKILHTYPPRIVIISHHEIDLFLLLSLIKCTCRKMLRQEPLLHKRIANTFWFGIVNNFFFL